MENKKLKRYYKKFNRLLEHVLRILNRLSKKHGLDYSFELIRFSKLVKQSANIEAVCYIKQTPINIITVSASVPMELVNYGEDIAKTEAARRLTEQIIKDGLLEYTDDVLTDSRKYKVYIAKRR